jgi:hypothetical protein
LPLSFCPAPPLSFPQPVPIIPNTIPVMAEKCSPSNRNGVRHQIGTVFAITGTLFGIKPERCSASPGFPSIFAAAK